MLDVKHYLSLYRFRKEMQEEGITKPSEDLNMPLDSEIILKDKGFYDPEGNLIMDFPFDQ